MCSLVQDLLQVELCVYCLVAGDELNCECVQRFDTSKLIYSVGIENDSCTFNLLATVYMEVQWNVYEHSQ